MNRRNFLRGLAGGIAAVAAAPYVGKLVPEPMITWAHDYGIVIDANGRRIEEVYEYVKHLTRSPYE